MMKLSFNSFIILCSVCLCSACGNSSVNANIAQIAEESLYKVTIRPPDMDTLQDLYLSEIADSVYYVALSDKPLLGSHLHVVKTDNAIVLKDLKGSLKLYDTDGNFKRKIGDIGRGRGEYINPRWTVKKTDTVYVYAPHVSPDRLSIYSLSDDSDGKMIGSITNTNIRMKSSGAEALYSLGNNILLGWSIYPHYPIELMIYNPQTNIMIDSLPNDHNGGGFRLNGYTRAISRYKDELYYMNLYSDTLYRLTEKEIAPFAIFDFGEYKFPIRMTKFTRNATAEQLGDILDNSIIPDAILRTSSTLYLRFTYGANILGTDFNRFTYALNLDDKTGRYCKTYFINDLDNGPDIWGKMQTIDVANLKVALADDEIASEWPDRIPPRDRLFPNNKMQKKIKNVDEFQRLFDKSTEDSNPIIQFLKLKQ